MDGYYLRPSETILRLRAEFPDFLICELTGELGKPCFTATSTRAGANGQPELVVTAGAEELRKVLSNLNTGAPQENRGGDGA